MENWKYIRELVFDKCVLSVTDMLLSHEFFNFVWRIRVTKQLKFGKNLVKSRVLRCHTTVWQVWRIWSIYVLFCEILLSIITIQSIIFHEKLYIMNNYWFWVWFLHMVIYWSIWHSIDYLMKPNKVHIW